MSGKVVLDTNIVIALFAQEAAVLEFLEKTDEVFIPNIVLGELYFGARKSARTDENIKRIDEFAHEYGLPTAYGLACGRRGAVARTIL